VEATKELEPKIAQLLAHLPVARPPSPPEQILRARSWAVGVAAEDSLRHGVPLERVARFPLRLFDARSGKDAVLFPGPASPFGSPARPDTHHKGATREVPD
jgi:hypothetical protein